MLDRILLSRVFQSWTYQRFTASTRSRISCAVVLSTRSRSYVIVWVGEVLEHGRVRARLEAGQVGRVRLKAETAKRGQVVACQRRRRDGDPRVGHIGRVGLGLLNLLGEQRLVDGAVVHVLQRHPSAGQHAVQLDDPADQIRVGLLPEGFFALTEELIQEGRDRVGERVRIEPGGTQRIPRQPAVKGQLDVVLAPVQLGQHPADVVAKIALHFQDQRRRAPLGIRRLPAEELARERVHTRRRLAGPDRAENRHARIEATLRDRQPFGGRALDGSDRVMDLADDDGRPVGRGRKWPRGKVGPAPHTDAHPGEPDPRCADEQLPGQEHGHAGRDVVPRDDGAIHVRGVVADEHRHGIGLGKHAGPRPGARDTDAADDQERTDESVKHGAARRC